MGHLAIMKTFCEFAAAHGFVEEEEEERRQEEEKQAERKEFMAYRAFWENMYSKISDDSAIINFEQLLPALETLAYGIRDQENKPIGNRWPIIHCELLLKTHRKAMLSYMRKAAHLAYDVDLHAYPPKEQEKIRTYGKICNNRLVIGFWL